MNWGAQLWTLCSVKQSCMKLDYFDQIYLSLLNWENESYTCNWCLSDLVHQLILYKFSWRNQCAFLPLEIHWHWNHTLEIVSYPATCVFYFSNFHVFCKCILMLNGFPIRFHLCLSSIILLHSFPIFYNAEAISLSFLLLDKGWSLFLATVSRLTDK